MNLDFGKMKIGVSPKTYMKGVTNAYNASEIVYHNVVIPKILPKLGLTDDEPATKMEIYLAERADGKQAIDHYLVDKNDTYASVQTRFRAPSALPYKDFTVRYDKPSAMAYTGKPVECEFFHFNADLMLYGICNHDLMEKDAKGKVVGANKVTDLTCWVLVDLAEFRRLCKNKKIMQQEGIGNRYKVDGDVLICPINCNKGAHDTRFTAVPIQKCCEMFPKLIIAQEGFVEEK